MASVMNRAAGAGRGKWPAAFLLPLAAGTALAADYFVAPGGADTNPGTHARPFATLGRAAAAVAPGDTCHLRAGVYRETFRPARSGEPGRPIIRAAYRNESAIISGVDPITGWKRKSDGLFTASMPWTLDDEDQVFADGAMLSEARWPDAGGNFLFEPRRAVVSQGGPDRLSCPQLPGPDGAWTGARLWCAGGAAWICSAARMSTSAALACSAPESAPTPSPPTSSSRA